MLFPVLKKNESYGEMISKLHEEVREVTNAATDYKAWGRNPDRDQMIGEVLDVMQVCIGILNQAQKDGVDLNNKAVHHLLKLTNRQNFVYEGFMNLSRADK